MKNEMGELCLHSSWIVFRHVPDTACDAFASQHAKARNGDEAAHQLAILQNTERNPI